MCNLLHYRFPPTPHIVQNIPAFLSSSLFFYLMFSFLIVCAVNLCVTNNSLIYHNVELPSTKLHTLLLDHQNTKLTWFIDWPKKEVLFNIDEAFTDDTEWFSFGFSQRGQIANSDVCYFVRSIYDEAYNEAIVSITITLFSRYIFLAYQFIAIIRSFFMSFFFLWLFGLILLLKI